MASVLSEIPGEWAAAGPDGFEKHGKPRVAEMLRAVGLDIVYERAEGDRLYSSSGEILDALGGYGAGLFGHNHPRLVARAKSILEARRPFLAQGSVRSLAGALAAKLSAVVGRTTNKSWVVQLGSTGADATEAAIKHAILERRARASRLDQENRAAHFAFQRLARAGGGRLARDLFARASAITGTTVADVPAVVAAVRRINTERLAVSPLFVALEGAFHGKTTGALSLTYNPSFREPWSAIGPRVHFLPAFDVPAIAPVFESAAITCLRIVLHDDGALDLGDAPFSNIAACFYEPIQGEGGVVAVSDAYARALRDATTKAGVPLVIDEIQSGMGRTGTFLASEAAGVVGDYYLLSKSLGGSLAKISALLVDKQRYDRDLGYLHTSTFVEDDYSSAIALEALALLDEEKLADQARVRGASLVAQLEAVRRRHPESIPEIRGRGLMIGVAFRGSLAAESPFLRVALDQGRLGYLIAGYMLRAHRVRVAPTLSAPETLRIQPSAYISEADLAKIASAVEATATLLDQGNAAPFARALIGGAVEATDPPVRHIKAAPPRPVKRRIPAQKVAFLGHFLEDRDLAGWDASLAPLDPAACRAVLDKTKGLLDPFLLGVHRVESANGSRAVEATIIGVPFTSSQIMDGFRRGDTAWARERIDRAVELAEEHGATIIGFGGYTSIVTNNCRTVTPERAAVTSGNALTAAACIAAVRIASAEMKLGPLRIGVVGALGNIGHVLAELLVEDAASLLLVGRASSRSRLEARAEDLRRAGARLVAISVDAKDLASCNVVLAASNAPKPILDASCFGESPVLALDVAVPGDIDGSVTAKRPNVRVLAGGRARLPGGQQIDLPGMPSQGGSIYGCLAETLLLGLEGEVRDFATGVLSPSVVRRAAALAARHGFVIDA
jgi:acetylornithine/succinyldiaminopimelate/putrescine aminotransferase/predicted amino acid dehydrogenase